MFTGCSTWPSGTRSRRRGSSPAAFSSDCAAIKAQLAINCQEERSATGGGKQPHRYRPGRHGVPVLCSCTLVFRFSGETKDHFLTEACLHPSQGHVTPNGRPADTSIPRGSLAWNNERPTDELTTNKTGQVACCVI